MPIAARIMRQKLNFWAKLEIVNLNCKTNYQFIHCTNLVMVLSCKNTESTTWPQSILRCALFFFLGMIRAGWKTQLCGQRDLVQLLWQIGKE